MVIHFHTHLHGLFERASSNRKNHELLQTQVNQTLKIKKQINNNKKRNIKEIFRKHTCIASLFPACDPPLMTLNAGTGNTKFLLPARLAICCDWKYSNTKIRTLNTKKERKAIEIIWSRKYYLVKRNFLDASPSFGNCKRHCQDGICTKLKNHNISQLI